MGPIGGVHYEWEHDEQERCGWEQYEWEHDWHTMGHIMEQHRLVEHIELMVEHIMVGRIELEGHSELRVEYIELKERIELEAGHIEFSIIEGHIEVLIGWEHTGSLIN